ncbi:MAG: geranylgeranyl diphosphate synthase, type [Chloroflexota bacterium]|jgi:geranylgeranyl diphosphate synthase type I|nr:geranylgeranyl diphosphate synthase, type [Chloroflexota bacterium]
MIESRLAEFSAAVDRATEALIPSLPDMQGLYGMLRYHLGWVDRSLAPNLVPAGKKLRPTLCLLVAEAVCGDWRRALPAATAVELIHNFSLVHDDIQDRSPLRHFRETLWVWQGEAQAINAGDALLVIAEQALTDTEPRLPAEVALTALRTLNRACLGLCEGQYLDMRFEHELSITLEEYMAMIGRKTARLFQCAAELGAYCAGADPALQARAAALGEALGMAFQVADDLLGTWAPESESGKPPLDVQTRKKNLPAVLGLHAPPSPASDRLRTLYSLDRDLSADETAEATRLLEELGVRDEAVARARAYQVEALQLVEAIGASDLHGDVTGLRTFIKMALPTI